MLKLKIRIKYLLVMHATVFKSQCLAASTRSAFVVLTSFLFDVYTNNCTVGCGTPQKYITLSTLWIHVTIFTITVSIRLSTGTSINPFALTCFLAMVAIFTILTGYEKKTKNFKTIHVIFANIQKSMRNVKPPAVEKI